VQKSVNWQVNSCLLFFSPVLGLGEGLTTTHYKNVTVTKRKRQPRSWTDLLEGLVGLGFNGCGSGEGEVAGICDRGNEASLLTKFGEFLAYLRNY
jgi:hypothetical protein